MTRRADLLVQHQALIDQMKYLEAMGWGDSTRHRQLNAELQVMATSYLYWWDDVSYSVGIQFRRKAA